MYKFAQKLNKPNKVILAIPFERTTQLKKTL